MHTDETGWTPDPVTKENLAVMRRRAERMTDAEIAELSFLADGAAEYSLGLLRDGMDLYEVLSLIADEVPLSDEESGEGRKGAYAACYRAYERAVFADLYLEKLALHGLSPGESDFLPQGETPETFTYVKNAYADEAYEVFSAEFRDPRVRYSHTFAEAAKSVLDGECGYCLLPLAEKGGVRLSSVTDLLTKNDLKIASVTPVFGFSGDAELWYALVSRAFRVPPVRREDDRYLEIRCSEESDGTLSDLLTAARVFGATLYRIHTVTRRSIGEDGVYYTVVFRTEGKSFTGLLTYLTLYTETYVPVGLYRNLE